MITSMTAYAKAEERTQTLIADVEIRTYNSRHLDFSIRVPHGYATIEEKIKSLITSTLTRGRVELKLSIRDDSEEANAYEVNSHKARAYYTALEMLASENNIKSPVSLDMLIGVHGLITPATTEIDLDKQWPVIETCILTATEEIQKMRQTEGDYLKKDFLARLSFIESAIQEIESGAEHLTALYQAKLKERIQKLIESITETDESRIIMEAAILADRSDISEELVRAKSHVSQFYDIMSSNEPGGRKLNFLLQEFNREFNTIGSKAANAKIAHIIVDVKAELEKMREQIQNVE